MIFTTKAEYGVRLLIQLGRQGGGAPVSLKAVAEAPTERPGVVALLATYMRVREPRLDRSASCTAIFSPGICSAWRTGASA